MTSRKRKVTYEENADANTGERSVNVEESHEETNESLTEQDDERYTPSKG